MTVSMRDVAAKAQVSTTTVSHVLNGTRPVADQTRTRVLRAVDQLNYYRNVSARLLVRGRSDLMGLVISDIENPYFPEVIKNFEGAAHAEGMQVLICSTNYDRSRAQNAVRRMLESRVQGVAVVTSQFGRDLELELVSKGVPVVLLDSPAKRKLRSTITVNYSTGLAEALKLLVRLGHKRIAVIAGSPDRLSAQAYKRDAIFAIRNVGLEPFRVLERDLCPESGVKAAEELLSGSSWPTAILCANDRVAIGALGAAIRSGYRVPEDVSIIGADDIWMAQYCHPPLTTVRVPRDALGKLAFEALLRMLDSTRKVGTEQVLETELVERGSTGAAHRLAFCGFEINKDGSNSH